MPQAPRVLVVDDESDIRELLTEYLTKKGFAVRTAADGTTMRALMATHPVDVVVLDLCLPDDHGLHLARFLRDTYTVGILMLTAANEVVDRILGLELGADDYLPKPFDPRELAARLTSLCRRLIGTPQPTVATTAPAPDAIRLGRCLFNRQAHTLRTVEGQDVSLTSMEFDLLQAFVKHPHQVLSRDRLLDLAHHREWDPGDRSLDIRVTRLRRKIEVEPAKPQVIKTVWGEGYMFVPSQAA